jgi:hypothetical protein
MLTIVGRALGRRKLLFDGFSMPPPAERGDGGPLRLRDLIEHIVRQEVEAYEQRQEARRLDRVLSANEIERSETRGKISPEGRDPKQRPAAKVDLDAAVATALEAFGDGLYLVVIDDREYRDLDAIVRLEDDSRITFVRLTFLAWA